MKNEEIEKIKTLTKQVRCYLEILKATEGCENINNLCGLCGVGSIYLQKVGRFLEFDFDFVCGKYESQNHESGHCWVEYKDLIIDVTANQFYKDINKPIYIIKKNKRYKKRFVNDVAIKYMNKYWPANQIFKTYEKQLEKITIIVGKQIVQKKRTR